MRDRKYTLWELTLYFLRLGSLGFGGPVALVGYMYQDLVEQKGWFTEEEYKEGLALAQLAPGPLAAQLGIYIGFVHYGLLGATLVGMAFVLPSFVMVVGLGIAYRAYGGLPWVRDISEFDFQGRKKKLNVICTDSTNIGKYLMQQQIESELFYNGSFKLAGQMVHLISLHGHSRSSSGKTQGYLLFNGQKRKLLIKAFSVQPESEMVKFYLRNGYLLIMRINDYRDEVYPFTYAVLKLNDTSLNILEEAEGIKIFKEKLYNIKFEYSRSAME